MPVLTIAFFQKLYAGNRRSSIVNNRYFNDILLGIKDAKPRACTGEKKKIVGSRRSINFLKNHLLKNQSSKEKRPMRCRSSLSHASRNSAPAIGDLLSSIIVTLMILSRHQRCQIETCNGRACRGEKKEIVGSRRSTNLLKDLLLKNYSTSASSLITACASISINHSGSANPVTTIQEDAGICSPKKALNAIEISSCASGVLALSLI